MRNKLFSLIFLILLSVVLFAKGSPEIPPTPKAIPTADFSGSPTIVVVGDSSVFTDLSTTPAGTNIISRYWYFSGGVPDTSTALSPVVHYNATGTYDVSLVVFNEQGYDSITKTAYIQVVTPSVVKPDPDFVADRCNILVGDSINFTDMTQGDVFGWNWKFEGGTPSTSTVQNPTFIKYTVAGNYKVTLTAMNSQGNDSMVKDNYIHVLSSTGTVAPTIDFIARPRLIIVGQSVSFTDSSLNNPIQWQWTFTGGTPSTSNLQNPIGIVYNTSGFYPVALCASNPNGTNCFTKTEYILVTSAPVLSYCDTISNILASEGIYEKKLSTGWGYVAGNNHKLLKAYADQYTNYTFGQVSALFFPVARSKAFSSASKIKFCVWNGTNAGPVGNPIQSVLVPMSQLPANYYKMVDFPTPALVDGTFYVGFEVTYVAGQQDTFSLKIANDRGPAGINTLWVKTGTTWKTYFDFFQNNSYRSSLDMEPRMCLVEVPKLETDNNIRVFPNPATEFFIIDFADAEASNVQITIFDLMGKLIHIEKPQSLGNQMRIETTNLCNGMYFLNINMGKTIVSKKISVIR